MRIALISNMTPASENIRGTSALPFHLMVHRPKDVEVDVYSLDYNKVNTEKIKESEERLGVKIHILPRPKTIDWIIKSKIGLIIRLFMNYPVHNYVTLTANQVASIKSEGYDGIWIYGEEMSRVSKQFTEYKRCHVLPDCTSLFCYRMMGQRFVFSSFSYLLKNFIFYRKFLRMERKFDNSENIHYLLVGKADTEFLKNINPGIQAHFLRHPHYDVKITRTKNNTTDKIKLLIAGRYDFYMKQDGDLMVDALCKIKELAQNYIITFLGKGWDKNAQTLRNAGYEVHHIKFAPNYIEEISQHDIQLTPISIGTGTKGKVLDALANGLLVVGTPYAMENIAVKNEESCIQYETMKELVEWLVRLSEYPPIIQEIAKAGHNAVLKEHGREKVAKEFFDLFK